MSSKKTETKQVSEQVSEELADEALEPVVGGNDPNGLYNSNPPAEVPSPSLYSLDPSSAKQHS